MKKSKNAFGNVFRRISTATLNSENELEVESCKDKTRSKEMHVGTRRERKGEHPKESLREERGCVCRKYRRTVPLAALPAHVLEAYCRLSRNRTIRRRVARFVVGSLLPSNVRRLRNKQTWSALEFQGDLRSPFLI